MRAILTYHSIDDSGSPISVDEETLRRHVRFLVSGQVRVVRLTEILSVPEDSGDTVAITFDDGFANFAEIAWPLLRDAAVPATLFLVAGRMGQDNSWGDRTHPGIPCLRLLDWNAAARLAEEGVDLGAHGHTHCDLRGVDAGTLGSEIHDAREAIAKRTGAVVDTFAYPYGKLDHVAATSVRGAFRAACTTELRCLARAEDPAMLPRLDAWYLRAPGRIESFGSRRFRGYIAGRAVPRKVRALVADLRRRPVRPRS